MPLVTSQEAKQHQAFLQRQKVYEERYRVPFFRYLQGVYERAATVIIDSGLEVYYQRSQDILNEAQLQAIYIRLYNDVTIQEARIQFRQFNEAESAQKDLIDDIVEQFPYQGGATIRLFRRLLNEYLVVRIGTRITEVTATTVKDIAAVIERGISDGLGGREIAALLRQQTDLNRVRSLMIARTETVTASNQGKFMSANSSDLVYEKRWIPANQPGRTRPTHLAMLNSPFIDLDQLFFIGKRNGGVETARFPGDESLSAENTVNCRCSLGFRVKRDRNGNPMRKTF